MPVGIRNNNPWNIKAENKRSPWRGTAGYDGADHVIFHHPVFAVRAVCRDLSRKYLGGRKTLRQIMERYSPKSDTLGSIAGQPRNNPVKAAEFIAGHMEKERFPKKLDIDDDVEFFNRDGSIKNVDWLCVFLEALYRQECGWEGPPLSRHLLRAGIEDYLKDFVND